MHLIPGHVRDRGAKFKLLAVGARIAPGQFQFSRKRYCISQEMGSTTRSIKRSFLPSTPSPGARGWPEVISSAVDNRYYLRTPGKQILCFATGFIERVDVAIIRVRVSDVEI